jgi:hypothetical protein
MQSIDKNDVDISRLFSWGKEVELKDQSGKPLATVYVRLVGDADVNRARVYSLRKSAELRKKLRTEGSDERLAFMPELAYADKGNIVEMIVANSVSDLARDAVKSLDLQMPVEPGTDAGLEEQEKYQAEIDAWPEKRQKKIEDVIMRRVEGERERLRNLPDEKLHALYESKFIDTFCEAEMNSRFVEMCVYRGSYFDPEYKKPLFKSLEEFLDLPSFIREQLSNAYLSIDINVEDLKK